uniref:Uncharacterized protein n=1 Tax=Podarcis muralis TaxID=64176 RepID=A0A670K8I1_PODMU
MREPPEGPQRWTSFPGHLQREPHVEVQLQQWPTTAFPGGPTVPHPTPVFCVWMCTASVRTGQSNRVYPTPFNSSPRPQKGSCITTATVWLPVQERSLQIKYSNGCSPCLKQDTRFPLCGCATSTFGEMAWWAKSDRLRVQ